MDINFNILDKNIRDIKSYIKLQKYEIDFHDKLSENLEIIYC